MMLFRQDWVEMGLNKEVEKDLVEGKDPKSCDKKDQAGHADHNLIIMIISPNMTMILNMKILSQEQDLA